jgi:hypothetical protein
MYLSPSAEKILYAPIRPGTPRQHSLMSAAIDLTKNKKEAIARFLEALFDQDGETMNEDGAESIWTYRMNDH